MPNSGATLNRVTGGNPSAIYGNLQSNGTLYLVNPSGIVVGPSGRIDTAGFLASTLDVSSQQFLAGGNLEFSGNSNASVENDGIIHASTGDVYLIANQVNNNGSINAAQGTVGLAAGSDVLFQQSGTEHLFVQATPAGTKRATGVSNTGTVRAAASELRAAGGNAYALAINNTGSIAVTGYKKVNGEVYLTSDGGSISNSGKISAQQANGNGGTIVVDGTAVTAAVSGTVTNAGTLDASATMAGGKGGKVTLKNMGGKTMHSGKIIAKGGKGGSGGNAEVSGATVQFTGTVDLTAPGGTTGNLLLDPTTFTVAASGGDETGAAVSATLETANLTLNADNTVTINDGITWTSGTTLTLSTNDAGSTINLNAPISGVNGGLIIDAARPFDAIVPNAAVDVASFTLQNGSWSQITASLPAFTASRDFELKGSSSFSRFSGGTGNAGSPYQIADIYGLQGLASPSGSLLGSQFVLANNIDAATTATWNNNAGFVPIGSGTTTFSGTLDGQGHTINDLTIDLPTGDNVGLFGITGSSALLENLGLTNVQITGSGTDQSGVGGLAGRNGGTITRSYSTGTVEGSNSTGGGTAYFVAGLVGFNTGTINLSYSSASVSAPASSNDIGGLSGFNAGSIANCYSIGTVTAGPSSSFIGGLSGGNFGTVTDSYSSDLVTVGSGSPNSGGLIGGNYGVYIGGDGTVYTGTILNSFWDTTTSGQSNGVGYGPTSGATGLSTSSLLRLSTYTGAGWDFGAAGTDLSHTWVIFDGSTRPMLSMEYSTTISNAHQLQLIGLNAATLAANDTVANDIDLTGDTNAADIWGTSTTNGGAGFVPIGNTPNYFTGTFAGQNHTVNGLYIDLPNSTGYVGLFGGAVDATIQDVGLTNIQVTGHAGVGGLAGYDTGSISNVYTTGSVNAPLTAGGLVGSSYGSISNSYSTASVTGRTGAGGDIGGLAGFNGGTITGSYSTGSVFNGSEDIGGLVGQNTGSITSSSSTSTVTGSEVVGGLVGWNDGGTISGSSSSGTVLGGNASNDMGGLVGTNEGAVNTSQSTASVIVGNNSGEVGGLVGWDDTGSVTTSNSAGAVIAGSASSYIGGLVGDNSGPVSDSFSSSAVTAGAGSFYVGGLAGYSNDSISNVHATGTVLAIGSSDVGGVVGFNDTGSSLSNAYGTGSVTAGGTSFNIGGLVGLNRTSITSSYNTGQVFAGGGSNDVGGLVGTNVGTINTSYSSAAVTGDSKVYSLGGLVGINFGTISNAYSTGPVSAGDGGGEVGGLVGYNADVISNAYSTGVVTTNGNLEVGGLVGTNGSGSYGGGATTTGAILNSFWDTTISGENIGIGFNFDGSTLTNVYGLTTPDLLSLSTYAGTNVSSTGAVVTVNSNGSQTNSGAGTRITFSLGWNIGTDPTTNTWVIYDGQTRPLLGMEYSTTITNAHQLQLIGLNLTTLGANYTLANNINLSGITNASDIWGTTTSSGAGFVPIGVDTATPMNVFAGTFDGQGHTINNLYIDAPSTDGIGLFGVTGSNGVVEDVGLTNVNVTGSTNVGGLVGYNGYNGATVETSYVSGTVTGNGYYAGGLVGFNNDQVETSYASASVSGDIGVGGLVGVSIGSVHASYATGSANGNQYVGGLVGYNNNVVETSHASGNVAASSGSSDLGGLIGYNGADGMVTSSYATGLVNGNGSVAIGGLVGLNGGTVQTSYASGTVRGLTNVGGLVGENSDSVSQSYSTGTVFATTAGSDSVGGLLGLNDAAGSVSFDYNTGAVNVGDGSFDVGGLVGTSQGTIGNSYNTGAVTVGTTGSGVGGLVGYSYNNGTISNSFNTGAVMAGVSTKYIGGLVGTDTYMVTDCYNSGSVTGNGKVSFVGGLAGWNEAGAISGSYNLGSVTVSASSALVGGLVGYNFTGGSISDSYSSGAVNAAGSTAVGGLVGENDTTIGESFWDTTTSGTNVGIGAQGSGTVTSVFGLTTLDLLKQSTYLGTNASSEGAVVKVASNGTSGAATAAGTDISFSGGWDFGTGGTDLSHTWVSFDGQTRPMLSSEYTTSISNAHQLQLIGLNATTLAANYTVTSDIDLSGTTNAADVWGTSTTNAGAGFVPIGSGPSLSTQFSGTFNGLGHTIDGLYISTSGNLDVGLFGYTGATASLENVGVTNVDISGDRSIGGLAGTNGGSINNAYTTGMVNGILEVGGLVGQNDNVINNAYSTALTNGENETGGLVGENDGPLSNAFSSGTVNGIGATGGLVGSNSSTISNSYSLSAVSTGTSSLDTGGLVGLNSGTITNVYSTGNLNVYGGSNAGGLVGDNTGSIDQAGRSGSISTSGYGVIAGGGLVGVNFGSISNSYSTGALNVGSDSQSIGGLVGDSEGSISTSYSSGAVNAANGENVGGLVGYLGSGTVADSYYSTDGSGLSVGVANNSGTITYNGVAASDATGLDSAQITAASSFDSSWDFKNVWTTVGDTVAPQLLVQPITVTGTTFDRNSSPTANVGVDLISGGSLLDSGYADGLGHFFFTTSTSNLTSGVLLTDATDNGNTYYQVNSAAVPAGGLLVAGGSLSVMADSASNSALAAAAGALTGDGINYSVSGTNLTTNPGVDLDVSNNYLQDFVTGNYTLDGNITSGGALNLGGEMMALTGSSNVTLTGTSVSLGSQFNISGSLAITSTTGEIDLTNTSTGESSASANSITLNAAGAVVISDSFIGTNGGDFIARGNGYASLVDSNGDSSGIDMLASSINAQGGNISLIGNAGYAPFGNGQLDAGSGVFLSSTTVATSGSGNITIDSTFDQNISCQLGIVAFAATGDSISTDNGQISIIGNVIHGTAAGTGSGLGTVEGVLIGSGSTISDPGIGGSLSITGYVPASDSIVTGSNFNFSGGVEISGVTLAVGGGGNITLNGAGGTLDTSASTIVGNTPFSVGVLLDNGTQLTTGTDSTISITGTGGSVITTGTFTGGSEGVSMAGDGELIDMDTGGTLNVTGYGGAVNAGVGTNGDGNSNGIDFGGASGSATIQVADGGTINLTGTGGSIDTTNASALGDSIPGAFGITLEGGTDIEGAGSTAVTLTGTGGSITSGETDTGAAAGILIGTDQTGESVIVATQSGSITMTGTGGYAPTLGTGVTLYGFDGGSATVQSTGGGAITINGTGGSSYSGDGLVEGNSIPNFGVAVVDNVSISTSGSISLTGTGSTNSYGVSIQELTSDPTLDSSPSLPQISAGGDFSANALTSTGIYVNAAISGASATFGAETTPGDSTSITSGPLTLQDATVTTSGGDITAFGSGYVSSTSTVGDPDGIDVFGSTLNAQGGDINLTGVGGYNVNSEVGPAGGFVGGAGVSIGIVDANNTLIETSGTGNITIQGTFSQSITSYQGIDAVSLFNFTAGNTNTLRVAQGTLSITGTVSQATFGDGTLNQTGFSGFDGVYVAGSQIEATDVGGSVSITGSTSGTTAFDNANGSSAESYGINLSGNTVSEQTVGSVISVGVGGTLTLNGTAGTIDSTYASGFNNAGNSTGLNMGTLTQISGDTGATITLTGIGGSATTNDGSTAGFGTSYTGSAEGVNIGEDFNSQGGIAQISVGDGGSISISGQGGSMDVSNDATPSYGEDPDAQGIHTKDSMITASGSSTITFMGTGGTVTSGSNTFGGATGISFDGYGGTNLVSSDSGDIMITGAGGASLSSSPGVTIAGFNGATTAIKSTTGNISITGTGGTGYNGDGTVVPNDTPNAGVIVADAATLMTGGSGTISLIGTGGGNGFGGSNSNGVEIAELNNSTIDAAPVLPTITSGGAFTANALSATGIFVNGTVTAASATLGSGTTGNFASVTSGPLVVQSATITLSGDFNAYGKGGGLDADGVDIEGSTINAQDGSINVTAQNGVFVYQDSEVPALDGLNIAGEGALIDTSTLETTGTGNITVVGDASIGNTTVQNALIGLEVASSNVTVQNGVVSMTGTVNSGTALANALANSAGFSGDGVQGLYIGQDFDSAASNISATGAGGAVALLGNVLGSTSDGTDVTSSAHDSDGVTIMQNGTSINCSGNGVAFVNGSITYNGIYIQGTAGTLTNNQTSFSAGADGLSITDGAQIMESGSGSITLIGQGGSNNTGTITGSAAGVVIKSDDNSGSQDDGNTQVATEFGDITILGTGGTSPNKGIGVAVNGKNGATTTVDAALGAMTINGVGGSGNTMGLTQLGTGMGDGQIPNDGVAILGHSELLDGGGAGGIAIIGSGQGVNGAAILVAQAGSGSGATLSAGTGPLSLTTSSTGTGDIIVLADSTTPVAANFNGDGITLDTQGNGNVTIDGPVSITSATGSGFLVQAPVITLDASITSLQGNMVLVDSTQFVNTAGSGALSASNGIWQVWSVNPPGSSQSTEDSVDGLTPDFIQYGATYGVTTPAASGNGLLYSFTPSALDVTLTGVPAKVYDGTESINIAANAYTATSGELVGGDSISAANALTGTLDSPNVGVDGTVTVDPAQLAGTINQGGVPVYGYTISTVSGAASVTPAPLTISASPVTKTYDGTDVAVGTATVTAGTLFTNVGTGVQDSLNGGALAFTNPNVGLGDKTVTASGVTVSDGNGGNNYTVTYVDNTTSTINPASLTIGTGDVIKSYDGTTVAVGTPTVISGTLYNNVITGQDSLSGGTYAFTDPNAGIGNKTVTVSGVTVNDGNNGGNYTVSYVNNTASTINPASLTVSTGNVVKTYDGTDSANGQGTAVVTSGTLYNSDSLSGGTFAFTDPNAGLGDRTVTVSGVTVNDGNGGGNYTVTLVANTTSTINPAPLTISASPVTKTYDGTDVAVGTATVTAGTLFTNVGTGVQDSLNGGALAFTDPNVGLGDKTVTASGVTVSDGNSGNNYTVTYVDNTTSTINPAALTIGTGDVIKSYDGTTIAVGTPTVISGTLYNNVITGQDSLSGGTYAFTDRNAGIGNKTVTVSGVTVNDGNNGGNYTVSYVNNTTSTINPATLTYTADPATSIYGANLPSLAGTVTGFVNGESLTSETSGTVTFSTLATPTSDVGNYAVTGSGLVANNGNYVFVQAPGNATALAITPATLTVSLIGTVSKVYDGTTTATPGASNYSLDGLVGEDVVGVTQATANYGTPDVGSEETLTVAGLALTGPGAGNYQLSNATASAEVGMITPATLTYVASPVTLDVGAALPESYSGTVTGFAPGDNLSNATSGSLIFTTTATSTSTANTYAIDGSGLSANNYTFVQAASNATALVIGTPSAPATTPIISTTTGGAAGAGSNLVPVTITPQTSQTSSGDPLGAGNGGNGAGSSGGEPPPPFSFASVGAINLNTFLPPNPLAESSGGSGTIGTGDVAQMGDGQVNNVGSSRTTSALNEALGPIVYANLADALKDFGDWAEVPGSPDQHHDDDETVLTSATASGADRGAVAGADDGGSGAVIAVACRL